MKKELILLLLMVAGISNFYAQEDNSCIYQSPAYRVYQNRVVQGDFTSNIISSGEIKSNYRNNNFHWKQHKDLSQYPLFRSDFLISDAMYNLSVEEMTNLIESDGTWRTGESWGGVWTRDVSYSTLLALSYMRPDISMNSLMRKVKDGRIMQDTGTGGSYPVSTDCIVWSMAAWQLYLVTGDKEWLKNSYEIIKKSIIQDEQIAYDKETGLVKGESSFLDWREETYPRWMQPADIYESECLGTNAAHFQANVIAAKMATLLEDKENIKRFESNAQRIKEAINSHLWMNDKGYYAQYLYGRQGKMVSPRSEALGEAFCVLFGIADNERSKEIIRSVPQTEYGNSCIFPQIPNIDPYHNNAVWPFVQSFWMWAASKVGNESAVLESIAAIYRAASMFATNKENFVAENGDYSTDTNSNNMLWSISGNISIVHRLFFGINYTEEGLVFSPFVPKQFLGDKQLTGFKYRNAVLDIEVKGCGNEIATFTVDGRKKKNAVIDSKTKGKHKIVIILSNNTPLEAEITKTKNYFSPETPKVYLEESARLAWTQIPNATHYIIIKNGKEIARVNRQTINGNRFNIERPDLYTEYQIIAEDANGVQGFASEPLAVYDPKLEQRFVIYNYTNNYVQSYGNMGNKAVEISSLENTRIDMKIDVAQAGRYVLDFSYANGSNSLTSGNTCAVRTLSVNGQKAGVVVFPQRGKDIWYKWGFSNSIAVHLDKGVNTVSLSFDKTNFNMNNEGINRALLDYIRLIKVK
ncbi:MAG: trehalase family glycosidase [Paludibacter sp.]|nr:trehalase family glycosidase [Paludibacter sp.]